MHARSLVPGSLDEFDVASAPTGGGISFFIREGSSVLITELTLLPAGK